MTKSTVSIAAILAVLALPLAAYAEPAEGAGAGAAGGSKGVVAPLPTAAGAANAAVPLSPDQSARLRQYLVREKTPSVKVAEKVALGAILPATVAVYPLPADIGVKTDYRYARVNDHAVLVAPTTHQVIQIID